MNRSVKHFAKIASFGIIFLTLIGYSYYQTKDYIKGPVLELIEPANNSTQHRSIVIIKGYAKNISHISMNDRQIFTDQAGHFQEKIILSKGYNIIDFSARDKYNRKNHKTMELVYQPLSAQSHLLP